MLASFELLVSCLAKTTMSFYYAVAKGRKPGIYQTWEECKLQVHKFPGPVYKKFPSSQEAQQFIESRTQSSLSSVSENLSHSRATSLEDFIALGTNRKTSSRTKRVFDSEEPNENSVKPQKRTKTLAAAPSTSSSSGHKPDKSEMHFHMDRDGFVIVYTDGACSRNGYTGAKAGIGVFFANNSPLNVSEPVQGRATNNMAEIQAVTRAAEIALANGIRKLRIRTDSEFLIKCTTQWMDTWKRRGWTTAKGHPVVNRVELEEMEAALDRLADHDFDHVRGHQGNYGNEMADRLAREGAEQYCAY